MVWNCSIICSSLHLAVVLQCGYLRLVEMFSVGDMFLYFCVTKDHRWLLCNVCNCGAVGFVFLVSCELSFVLVVVDSFSLYSLI